MNENKHMMPCINRKIMLKKATSGSYYEHIEAGSRISYFYFSLKNSDESN